MRGNFFLATVSAACGYRAVGAVLTLRSQGDFSEGLSSAASDIILPGNGSLGDILQRESLSIMTT